MIHIFYFILEINSSVLVRENESIENFIVPQIEDESCSSDDERNSQNVDHRETDSVRSDDLFKSLSQLFVFNLIIKF
jgi:hypothetical protein